ncbi:MAG: hypothetical protein JWO08_4451 [Verrucomicrobiaceae bacterium]|nr:hypothetical protein [Verrucomicrobiaceae bacterium]
MKVSVKVSISYAEFRRESKNMERFFETSSAGQTSVPAGLSGVKAIAAGVKHADLSGGTAEARDN